MRAEPSVTTVAAVIPAWNEAQTVGAVVHAARQASLVHEVVVVDNASSDDTALVATAHGARVVRETTPGKGEAMRAGVEATGADVVVFLDGDLVGLLPEHVDALVAPVLDGSAAMTCGLFDRGPLLNPVFLDALPILTGQRALRRELFLALDLEDVRGYRVEAALNSLVHERDLPVHAFVCRGLWHRTKEEKFDSPVQGFLAKQAMLATAVWSYAVFRLRRLREAQAAARQA
jgi:glycosyltransferase involved in cell wall biosynthesis